MRIHSRSTTTSTLNRGKQPLSDMQNGLSVSPQGLLRNPAPVRQASQRAAGNSFTHPAFKEPMRLSESPYLGFITPRETQGDYPVALPWREKQMAQEIARPAA